MQPLSVTRLWSNRYHAEFLTVLAPLILISYPHEPPEPAPHDAATPAGRFFFPTPHILCMKMDDSASKAPSHPSPKNERTSGGSRTSASVHGSPREPHSPNTSIRSSHYATSEFQPKRHAPGENPESDGCSGRFNVLEEVRLGESPTCPKEIPAGMLDEHMRSPDNMDLHAERPTGPQVSYADPPPVTPPKQTFQLRPTVPSPRPHDKHVPNSQPTFIKSSQQLVNQAPQMIFTGPVFIGVPIEDVSKFFDHGRVSQQS
jgi:hypothetical protein